MIAHGRTWSILGILAAAALAGCVSSKTDDAPAPPEPSDPDAWTIYKTPQVPEYDFANAFDVVHAHDVRELHTNSYGLKLIAYTALQEGLNPAVYEGGFIEVDVKGNLAVVATLTGMRAFTLVDISDSAQPKTLSHFYSGNDNWDVRFSDDGRYVFVGCQGTGLYTFTPVGQCTDYTGIPSPAGDQDNGIITVDVSDPKNPKALCWTPSTAVHNLETMTTDNGTTLVSNNAVELFVLQDDGCLMKTAQVPGRHDAYLQKHPITGKPLLYTGTSLLSIYDVSDPGDPVDIGTLDVNNVTGATAWHEQSPAPNTWFNGTHVTFGAGERFGGAPGPVTVIDTTDPTLPKATGTWILPVPAPDEEQMTYGQASYMFSEHNIAVNQWGQACIGHYHAGVWIIDVSTPERMKEPVTLGFYLPHERAPEVVTTTHPAGGAMTSSPYVWGCAWTEDGTHVLVPDMTSGLYILEGTWFEPKDA